MPNDANADRLNTIIRRSAEILGSATGSALGMLASGPVGGLVAAVAGTVTGQVLQKVGQDMCRRHLSPREELRVGAVTLHAINAIWVRQLRGETPRSDEFFTADASDRSPADELFEGILLKCRSEHEEKKARFIGNIYVNAAFGKVSPVDANAVLEVADSLSYRQLCILSGVGRVEEFPSARTYFRIGRMAPLITAIGGTGDPVLTDELNRIWSGIRLLEGANFASLSRFGQLCFDLMGLTEVPAGDVQSVVDRAMAAERGL